MCLWRSCGKLSGKQNGIFWVPADADLEMQKILWKQNAYGDRRKNLLLDRNFSVDCKYWRIILSYFTYSLRENTFFSVTALHAWNRGREGKPAGHKGVKTGAEQITRRYGMKRESKQQVLTFRRQSNSSPSVLSLKTAVSQKCVFSTDIWKRFCVLGSICLLQL